MIVFQVQSIFEPQEVGVGIWYIEYDCRCGILARKSSILVPGIVRILATKKVGYLLWRVEI